MRDWLERRFGRPEWDLARAALPWGDAPGLAQFLETQLGPGGERLPHSGMPLPDDERVSLADGVRFAAGARDGIALHHLDAVDEPEVAQEVVRLLRDVLADGGLARLPELYAAMVAHRALTWVDQLGPGIARAPQPDPNRLYALALWLATQAPDREPVKAGIAMLALLELDGDELGLLRLLGSHDEFTLYAVVALSAQSEEPEQELWSLARRVTGWGRIHAVQRLCDTGDPEIKDWLLREGFRNDVTDRYLALSCAVAGDLALALADPVDDALLFAATDLLGALIEPAGPTAGMEAWEEGALAVARWMDRLGERAQPPLSAVAVLARIVEAAGEDEAPWPPDVAPELAGRARVLLADPRWRARVLAGLAPDSAVFPQAVAAATALGMDTFDAWLRRLDPGDPVPWDGAIDAAGSRQRLALVLDRVADLLPADLVAGEDRRHWVPATAAGRVLSTLLSALAAHPGLGGDHLLAGLQSPLAQHRNLALRALVGWPQSAWPDGAHERVARLAQEDPEPTVRENALAAWGVAAEA
ncbi:hypothetical protein L6R53_22035 [Myxococcota bacterium]|nr:hypothetical protein [Myxococcota bacterium]